MVFYLKKILKYLKGLISDAQALSSADQNHNNREKNVYVKFDCDISNRNGKGSATFSLVVLIKFVLIKKRFAAYITNCT